MKLKLYIDLMFEGSINDKCSSFGRKIGASPSTVRSWYYDNALPSRDNIAKIVDATAGSVQITDFYDSADTCPYCGSPTQTI